MNENHSIIRKSIDNLLQVIYIACLNYIVAISTASNAMFWHMERNLPSHLYPLLISLMFIKEGTPKPPKLSSHLGSLGIKVDPPLMLDCCRNKIKISLPSGISWAWWIFDIVREAQVLR